MLSLISWRSKEKLLEGEEYRSTSGEKPFVLGLLRPSLPPSIPTHIIWPVMLKSDLVELVSVHRTVSRFDSSGRLSKDGVVAFFICEVGWGEHWRGGSVFVGG